MRKKIMIGEGTKATVVSTSESVLLKPITRSYIKSLRGSLIGTKAMETFMAERKRERDFNEVEKEIKINWLK